jgi:hypothetical protein
VYTSLEDHLRACFLDITTKMAVERTQCTTKVPQASLLGLPTELRLQIFSYLAEPIRFHLDSSNQDPDPRSWTFEHRRPCYTPDPFHPSLCSTPRFSGLTSTASMCHAHGGQPTNHLAIRAVCKTFSSEAVDVFENYAIGLTIEHRTVEARSVLRSMSALQLAMLVDLTIQVLPLPKEGPWCQRWPRNGGSISTVLIHLRKNLFAFPNLRTMAIQQPKRLRRKRRDRFEMWYHFEPEDEWRRQWYIVDLKAMFGDRVQIVVEWWYVLREGHVRSLSGGDEMVRARGFVGNSESVACTWELEMSSEPIVAEWGDWTECWKNRGMGFDKEYSPMRDTRSDDKDYFQRYRCPHYATAGQVATWVTSARRHLEQAERQIRCRH